MGWVALVVDDRPVWDWATRECACVCLCVRGLTIDNDRATLGPRFSASGPSFAFMRQPDRGEQSPLYSGKVWLAGLLTGFSQ